MLDNSRLHHHQPAAHTAAFHLEYTRRLPSPQQHIGGRVIRGDVIQAEVDAVPVHDQLAGASHDGERGQAEEVHLEHAQLVEHLHLVLGHGLDG